MEELACQGVNWIPLEPWHLALARRILGTVTRDLDSRLAYSRHESENESLIEWPPT